jgi:gluconolactonase
VSYAGTVQDLDAARGSEVIDQGRAFQTHRPSFAAVLGDDPRLERVAATDAHEGPCYRAVEDALYFTSLPRPQPPPDERGVAGNGPTVTIRRLALDGERFRLERGRVSTVIAEANAANGMSLDARGRLIVCEQGSWRSPAAITRVDPDSGAREVLVDDWRGLPLNSPNDVAVKSDGTLWFTDPGYGSLQGFRPEPSVADRVYCYEPGDGRLRAVAEDFDKPNGIAFSPDESVLYVTDSGANQEPGSFYPERPHHIRAFEVTAGARLTGGRVFAVTEPGFPDGLKVDAAGRVYASCFDGVQVFSPAGELIGEIKLPGAVNFTFGGTRRNVLLITTDTGIWAAVLNAAGPGPVPAGNPKGA